VDQLFQDLRHTFRGLRRQPGFFLVTVLSLVLGMGINTAIFSVTDSLLWKPLPVRDPDRTVYVFHLSPGNPDEGTSFRAFEAYHRRTDLFSAAMASTGARPMFMGDPGQGETVYAEPVTSGFFSIAEVALQFGRPLDASSDAADDPAFTAILSHRSWIRRFGADPAIVGRTIRLNGRSFVISGVAREGFNGFDTETVVDLWIPMPAWAHAAGEPARLTSDEHWLTTLAILRDGVSIEQAQAALSTMSDARRAQEQQVKVRPIGERLSGTATDLLVISGAAFLAGGIVLALAWTNAASLIIARAAARQREMSVRAALGGSRTQLVRLWLVETAVISGVACLGAVVFASWILNTAVTLDLPSEIGEAGPSMLAIDFHLDVRVLTFVLGLSAVTTLVLGLLSGVRLTSARAIRQQAAWTERRYLPGLNLRSTVLALQLVLSLVLLIPAGLLVRSWINGAAVDPGFSTENVLLVPISSNQSGAKVEKPPDFEAQLIARVASAPDVPSVTAMDPVPLWFGGNFAHFGSNDDDTQRMGWSRVGPQYFRTLRLRLVQGREFTAADNASAPQVAIVNETFARQFFPGANAIGRTIRSYQDTCEVVGIAADVKYRSLADAPQPWVYRPLAQEPTDNASLSLAVRFDRDTPELRRRIERDIRALAPAWPVVEFRSLDEGLKLQRLLPRTGAAVLGVLGTFALVLAAVGIYGVTAYVVTARAREMGIRLALGSPPAGVTALVIRQVMWVCVPGAVVGTVLAAVAGQLMTALLVSTSAADPATFVVIPMTLLAVAVLAAYLPARRAARTHPLSVLRAD
jgi:predicted permease